MKTNQTLERPEIELSFRDLFLYILTRWKIIVICMLVCALALGGYKYYKDNRALSITTSEAFSKEDMEDAESAIAYYKNAHALEEYCDNSFLMQIDSENTYMARLIFAIDGCCSSTVAKLYSNMATEQEALSQVAVSADCDVADLTELVSTSITSESNSAGVQSYASMLTVQIIAPTEELRDALANAISTYLPTQKATADIVGEHTFSTVSTKSYIAVNEGIRDTQNSKRDSLENAIKAAEDAESSLSDNALTYYKTKLAGGDVDAASGTTASKAHISLKFILIGLAVGLILAVILLALAYMFSGKVRSADDIESNFGISVLGTLGTSAAPKCLKKLFGIAEQSEDAQLALIQAKLALITADYSEGDYLYVTSSVATAEEMQSLASRCIYVRVLPCPLTDAESLAAMVDAKGIILVENANQTSYTQLHKLLQLCMQFGKPDTFAGIVLNLK